MTAQKLFEKAKKIAFEKKCTINEIYEPMLVQHGYLDEKGVTLKTHSITIGLTEDLNEIPTESK
tara:strand:+ start:281 stop:472 length:192 start_codon:yes stop_codon:yes gene_type:complete